MMIHFFINIWDIRKNWYSGDNVQGLLCFHENIIYIFDMKVFNPKTKKNQDLFETLIPTWTVGCTNDNIVNGDKGCAVYITVSAEDEASAKNLALANEEFMSHIHKKDKFERKYLTAFKPTGSYVIGRVRYFEGDPRL